MKSYTQLRNTYGVDTKNTATANLTQGDEWMNDFHRRILAKADWPFLHRERKINTFAPDATFTVVAGTDVGTAAENIMTLTGTEVRFTTTDTLPAGLSLSTTYWLIYQSATTFKVASSLANALAGTAIDITDTGTGTHTITVQTRMQPLPYDVDLVESTNVVVGTTKYTPTPLASVKKWDELNYSDQQADQPQFWFVQDSRIGFYPRPASAGNVVTLNSKIRVADLNVADYTTGNIDIVTNGSVKVTGAGSPGWTTPMVGRWLRITHSNTAASSGDHEWYEIAAVESTTVLYLSRPYGGRSLTTGASAAYTIGQMPQLPEAFHDLPELYAARRYWLKEDDKRAKEFGELLTQGVSDLGEAYGISDLSMVIDDGNDSVTYNPNLTISL